MFLSNTQQILLAWWARHHHFIALYCSHCLQLNTLNMAPALCQEGLLATSIAMSSSPLFINNQSPLHSFSLSQELSIFCSYTTSYSVDHQSSLGITPTTSGWTTQSTTRWQCTSANWILNTSSTTRTLLCLWITLNLHLHVFFFTNNLTSIVCWSLYIYNSS